MFKFESNSNILYKNVTDQNRTKTKA